MVELMESLLDKTVDNAILEHYIQKAERAIKNYSNITEIPVEYDGAIVELAIHFYKNRDNLGVTQKSQGGRSQTNKDGIPQSIKCELPTPRVRVL